jgi:hypothetical protein
MSVKYPWHPAAELFPLLKGDKFDDLVNDIRTHGLQQPIVLYQGKILDGRNREMACIAAKVNRNMSSPKLLIRLRSSFLPTFAAGI